MKAMLPVYAVHTLMGSGYLEVVDATLDGNVRAVGGVSMSI